MMRLASVVDGSAPRLQSDPTANTPLAGGIDPTLMVRQFPPRTAQPAGK